MLNYYTVHVSRMTKKMIFDATGFVLLLLFDFVRYTVRDGGLKHVVCRLLEIQRTS